MDSEKPEIRITRRDIKAGSPRCQSAGPILTRDGETHQIQCTYEAGHGQSHNAWVGFGARFYWDDDGLFAVLPVGEHFSCGSEWLMAHSSHRRWKGCQLCKPQKFKDHGRAVRDPFAVRRKLGKRRRAGRHDIPADQQ